MKINDLFMRSLVLIILLIGIMGLHSIFQSQFALTKPATTFEHLKITAIFDNRRNQEYLYLLDSRTGELWKYNMDSPEKPPTYIGTMVAPGKALELRRKEKNQEN
ncbi:MAG: hypothetical protein ACE5NG_05675 [bacterium]